MIGLWWILTEDRSARTLRMQGICVESLEMNVPWIHRRFKEQSSLFFLETLEKIKEG